MIAVRMLRARGSQSSSPIMRAFRSHGTTASASRERFPGLAANHLPNPVIALEALHRHRIVRLHARPALDQLCARMSIAGAFRADRRCAA